MGKVQTIMAEQYDKATPYDEYAFLSAAKWMLEAEAVLVCAGAGMSVKSGAGENVYGSQADFQKQYPWFCHWGYKTAYETMGLLPDGNVPLEAKWAYWAQHYHNMRW